MNLSIILEILRKQVSIEEILVIGGGAKGAVWRQIMADIFNAKVIVPNLLEEAGSMGAAVTGGVGIGLYQDFNIIHKFLEINTVLTPNQRAVASYQPVKELFDDCYYALQEVYTKMAKYS